MLPGVIFWWHIECVLLCDSHQFSKVDVACVSGECLCLTVNHWLLHNVAVSSLTYKLDDRMLDSVLPSVITDKIKPPTFSSHLGALLILLNRRLDNSFFPSTLLKHKDNDMITDWHKSTNVQTNLHWDSYAREGASFNSAKWYPQINYSPWERVLGEHVFAVRVRIPSPQRLSNLIPSAPDEREHKQICSHDHKQHTN